MEISPVDYDGDPPLLTDSGTESYTESPVAEEVSEQSEAFAPSPCQSEESAILCETNSQIYVLRKSSGQNLLDKDISIDEESLDPPLEPFRCPSNENTCNYVANVSVEHTLSLQEITHFEMSNTDMSAELEHINGLMENFKSTEICVESNIEVNVLDTSDHSQDTSRESSLSCSDDKIIPSILRRQSCSILPNTIRRVSFPNDSSLATYREPEFQPYWDICNSMTSKDILQNYQNSCRRHKAIELDAIKNQILEIKNNQNRSATLNLTSLTISRDVCETLEDLFKVTNFRSIHINESKFTQEAIREFLNLLEYYESTSELVISEDFNDFEVWTTLCIIIGKTYNIESLVLKEMTINEQYMRCFWNGVRCNKNITTLKFDSCTLVKLPTFYLVQSITFNNTVRELYLPQTGLYTKEADCLGRCLSINSHLQVLDVSNNCIGDRGFDVLAKGLTNQSKNGPGLSVLIIFNNQLTEKSGSTICNIIGKCKNLHALNVGFNNLTDEVIPKIKDSLGITKSLEGLGLQSTLLTCIGASELAEAIENNCTLQKINLKGNKAIRITGLENLSRALTNSKVVKMELDDANRSFGDPQEYIELVQKINHICTINKSIVEQLKEDEVNLSRLISRKVSLSCEPRFVTPPIILEDSITENRIKYSNPSPMPSPGGSSGSRSRFQVSKVPDKLPASPSYSRFKVFAVTGPAVSLAGGDGILVRSPPPDEEEEEENRFPNVRSSVSSIDSVESLTPPRDSFILYSPTHSGESD